MRSLMKYIAEKLVVDKDYKCDSAPNLDELKNGGWKKLTINMVPSEFADIDLNQYKCNKRLYNGDGTPTIWFAWWMILCIYGPMSRAKINPYVDVDPDYNTTMWSQITKQNIIKRSTTAKGSEAVPMSEWNVNWTKK